MLRAMGSQHFLNSPLETTVMDTINRMAEPSVNGTAKHRKAARKPSSKTSKPRRASLRGRQRLALIVGSVGVFVLALSLVHCTQALAVLTGSPIVLALLLAIGIDAGMVAAELAAIVADGEAHKWASRYVVAAVALSVGLNSFASAQHAERWPVLAAIVGAVIPLLVYMLARVAGHLWRD